MTERKTGVGVGCHIKVVVCGEIFMLKNKTNEKEWRIEENSTRALRWKGVRV